ncbi:hypothetical protein GQ44DRAFT_765280 [Phaeosphaeriaceae sp. PMI808]|nr:hypothetical protein GQ44DRAFT_765280 [Phaeosphaeriaceae sp. PMI808]
MTTLELERLGSSVPERELSPTSDNRRPDHSTTSLATTNFTRDASQPYRGFRSYLQQLFKALGLSAGFNLLAKKCGWPVTEKKKVVMKKSKFKATLRCVIHLVPVSAAIALLVLNGSNHYIGGELTGTNGQDTQKLAALLFAAKLHALFMLASLSAIVITYIRKELVFGNGVPFGIVFSANQFKDLTFLWSPELWGTVYHEWEKKQKKWFIICLLVVCSIAGLTVGPSTGILMRPRLDEWPAGGTTFWINATETLLNPERIEATAGLNHCSLENGDMSCPAGGWQVFNEQYFPYWKSLGGMGAIPQSLFMPGRSSLRQFVLRTRNVHDFRLSLLWANAFTLASVSPSIVADALVDLERLWINAAANADIGNFKYRRDASFTTNALQPLVLTRCYSTDYASVPKSNAGPATYHACGIDSRYAKVTLKTSRSSITHVFSAPSGYDDVGTFNPAYRPIKLSANWARYLNPIISTSNQTNDTVFSSLAATAGLWTSKPSTNPEWFPIIVENILAMLLANAIGRTNFDRTMVGTLAGLDNPSNPWSLGKWVYQILSRNGRLGYGGNAFDISEDDEVNATRFVLKAQILGYAFSTKGKTQIAAMIALSLYVLLVLFHIGYSATTGWYSSSWGSPSELTALAMNSAYTSKLENTGGGIESIDVFKEKVWVRLKDERAQMVFA